MLDVHARGLMDVCGACERIRNTPLASSYRALVRLALLTYVITAPWSVTLDLGLWALPALDIGFFFLLGIELTAEDVEEPFGIGADELPLEDYCQTIETFVKETMRQDL
jgi:putative membrane protein